MEMDSTDKQIKSKSKRDSTDSTDQKTKNQIKRDSTDSPT